jgi:hypothetical protein
VPARRLTAAQFKFIFNLDMDAVETAEVFAISHFADLWLNDQVLNQPIRMDADNLKCELGQDTFSAGKEAWKKISAAAPAPVPAAANTEVAPGR